MLRKMKKSEHELPDVFIVRSVYNPEQLVKPLNDIKTALGKRAVFYDIQNLQLPLFKLSSVDVFRRTVANMSEPEREHYLDEFQAYLYGCDGSVDIDIGYPESPIRTDVNTGEIVFDVDNGSDFNDFGMYVEPNGRVDYFVHRAVRAIEDHFETVISSKHRGHNLGSVATKSNGLVHSHIAVGRINDEYLDHDYQGYNALTHDIYNEITGNTPSYISSFPESISLGAMQTVLVDRHKQEARKQRAYFAADVRSY